MKDRKYLPLITNLYINYIFQGIGLIIIAQNMSAFQDKWNASISQVTLVISALGVGRILSLNYAGYFSDKYGRKASVMAGMISYLIFFVGIISAPNYKIACLVTLFEGAGNSFLDTGTYPALAESYGNKGNSSFLSVLIKAFISTGQFVLPLVIQFIFRNDYYFGWTFIGSAVLLLINMIMVSRREFPKANIVDKKDEEELDVPQVKSNVFFEGMLLFAFSFISVSLFTIFITWAPKFAENVLQYEKSKSVIFVSIYSGCSFASVLLTSFLTKKGLNVAWFAALYTLLTGVGIGYAIIYPSSLSMYAVSFAVGFFAAGGIWQLGVSLVLEFFPAKKGQFTGLYSLAAAISLMVTPYLTGVMAESSIKIVFTYNMVLAFIATVLLVIVAGRYKKLIKSAKK